MGMVNAFVLASSDGCIVVDAGLPGTEGRIAAALARCGYKLSDVGLIIITHGHIDHAGNAERLRKFSGAPILLHRDEAKYCSRDTEMNFCSTGLVGNFMLKARIIQQPYAGFQADIELSGNDEFDLSSFGIAGRVYATPGHTGGSVSVALDDGQVFAGDLVSSGILLGGIMLKGRPKRPPFEENPMMVANSLESLINAGARKFHLGHGGPISAETVRRHVANLRRLPGRA